MLYLTSFPMSASFSPLEEVEEDTSAEELESLNGGGAEELHPPPSLIPPPSERAGAGFFQTVTAVISGQVAGYFVTWAITPIDHIFQLLFLAVQLTIVLKVVRELVYNVSYNNDGVIDNWERFWLFSVDFGFSFFIFSTTHLMIEFFGSNFSLADSAYVFASLFTIFFIAINALDMLSTPSIAAAMSFFTSATDESKAVKNK
jgi:hypothetical protein